jgi:FkbM family methyltransferase
VSCSSYSLVFFTPEVTKKDERQWDMLNTFDDSHAKRLVQEHSLRVPFLPPLQFRSDSTDALVINELLDSAKGSAYTLKHHVGQTLPSSFSLASHNCVLDVGAHIGIFSRLALAEGCSRVIAYEPEHSNFELLRRNLNMAKPVASKSSQPVIELHSAAVANTSGSRTLVRARNENSGKQNTWRHSLEEYSQYVDRSNDLPSVLQKKTLDRFPVDCVSFFGSHEEGKKDCALVPGVTFVKLDCEGAEIDIILSEEASRRSSWLDCTHLVVEWSFTKERRVDIFHKAMNNLKLAGFEVYYEGLGSWWDTDAGTLWPYPNDAIVVAAMKQYEK